MAGKAVSPWLLVLLVIVQGRIAGCLERYEGLQGKGAAPTVGDGAAQLETPREQGAATWATRGTVDEVEEVVDKTMRDRRTSFPSHRARNLVDTANFTMELHEEMLRNAQQCSMRREWQPPCDWWSHKTHHRYLLYGPLGTHEGLGGNLMRVAWAFSRAISYDLEVVFESPLKAGHDVGSMGHWLGVVGNPLLAIEDPLEFSLAAHERVPSWEYDQSFSRKHEFSANWYDPTAENEWFRERMEETSVVYIPNTKTLNKYRYFGRPVDPTPANSSLCSHAKYALERVFWNSPQPRDRCRSALDGIGEMGKLDRCAKGPLEPRPWFIAMHIRRGDKTVPNSGATGMPFFEAAARTVLAVVARITPGGNVFFALFSEGTVVDESEGGTGELQLVDESGRPIDFNVTRDFCQELGLHCNQELALNTTAFQAMECLATADILIGDKSQFSEGAAAFSTNVKIVHKPSEQDQYAVTVDKRRIFKEGRVSEEKEREIEEAVRSWYGCYQEARSLPDRSPTGNHRVYQTIDY